MVDTLQDTDLLVVNQLELRAELSDLLVEERDILTVIRLHIRVFLRKGICIASCISGQIINRNLDNDAISA
jgi:hypothetical protein